jgi:hypothetical protein
MDTNKTNSVGILEQYELKSFNKPIEIREFPKGRLEIVKVANTTIGRAILKPGWRWSTCVKPLANTESCQSTHFQYLVSGILRVKMEDGTEFDCEPGDISLIPPGHDAWVVGDEPVVMVDFLGMVNYAKPK